MKLLITGANGLLATNTIKYFLELGHEVKGLLRSKEKFVLPPHPKLELVQGDITEPSAVENAVKDCDAVIHIAALTSPDLPNYDSYYKVNVAGSENLVKAAIKFKLKKFIYVSSANTMGFGSSENPGTETTPLKPPFTESLYAKSKLEAQQKLFSYADKIAIVTVNPTFMLGPYDGKPSSGEIILMGYRKKFIFYPPGGKNFVDVRDAARGISAALKKGKNREIYLLAGQNLSYKEFFQKLVKKRTGAKSVMIKVPKPLLLIAGYAGDFLRKLNVKTSASSANMKILCVKNYYSAKKAEEELDVHFHPIGDAIEDAIAWFQKNGKL
ncbi:NAD-dependent epimerase/dehydratase family protein [Salegentibacter sp. F188]|uniref:NAD-dependent epimerase/dehydratase family protein n=1 Tax=Autumnicola patrickiae TaxID=3075591 RepID=A0ABU3E000_9FLAO|nr:NAD-dependent epimerase/dehydratase family protein [Salegentibacter sp. F188]MDT0688994.1 NAD-dependent epimerase/dehydratase family protein [Salegentibacter sp. F188]